jgi:hypothetical protein
MSMIYQIVNTDPAPPSTYRPDVSADLDAIVLKAIAKEPGARYATWEEFGQALGTVWTKMHQAEERGPSDTERFNLCRTLSFFKEFPENELWEVLRISKWRKFPANTVLIKEGDQGDSFFVLAGGYVRVTRGTKTLSVLTGGDCFGEMSYLAHKDAPQRSATVTTTSDCIIMKIRAEDLRAASLSCRRLFDERFLNTLVMRLENANEQLAVMS